MTCCFHSNHSNSIRSEYIFELLLPNEVSLQKILKICDHSCLRDAIKTIKNVCDVHKNYWKGLKFRVKIPDLIPPKDQSAGIKDDNTKNSDFLPLFDSDIPKDELTGTESEKVSQQDENKTDTDSKSFYNTDITKDKTSKQKEKRFQKRVLQD
ncbi:unnamed protein product [Mytilus coruscus]|uniref:Uncharacterized protein n=1 Tax=Mytilus coruscus TaxID=42192 RepID=A0A6J8DE93_MYTCO|nr:unnamed protein product [Mytilus coruscus]